MIFAEIKTRRREIWLSESQVKDIKDGIIIQLKKSINESDLPFIYTDIKKGQQDYSLSPLTAINNIKFIFIKS